MNTVMQIETSINMTIYPEYLKAALSGDSLSGIFPRGKVTVDDESDEFIYYELSVLGNKNDHEGSPIAEITFEKSSKCWWYGMFEFSPMTVSRGELVDPGGWDLDTESFKGPFAKLDEMSKSLTKTIQDKEAADKAVAESEAESLKAEQAAWEELKKLNTKYEKDYFAHLEIKAEMDFLAAQERQDAELDLECEEI